jgi:aminopeptidase
VRAELPGRARSGGRRRATRISTPSRPPSWRRREGTDASLVIQAPDNTRALAGSIRPAWRARRGPGARSGRRACAGAGAARSGRPPAARPAGGHGHGRVRRLRARATFLDRDDPWRPGARCPRAQAGLIARLAGARELHIEAEGTDLRLRVDGRTWVNSDGKRNMPSGEVFTGPHEDSAEGRLRVTIPSSPRGVAVEGVELTFREGRVADASARVGEEYLLATLETDPGARRLGELGIGTNTGIDRPVGAILFDEKIGGTVHLALGSSYPETGGTNESAVHWDLIVDLRQGGTVRADGEVVVDGAGIRGER